MNVKQIEVLQNIDCDLFQRDIYPKRVPVILCGLDIGPCTKKWTPEYIAKAGGDIPVKIHVSKTPNMDFINKNFMYKTLPFSDLVTRASMESHPDYFICPNEFYYLRSLGDGPRGTIADIREQFPSLASDIILPEFFKKENFFSSVFRIASKGLQLWTHYDVMDNLLIQVSGKKRAVLWSPQEALSMYLNGDKSEVLDIDNFDKDKFPLFSKTVRWEGVLEPGDVLFIPALWFHNIMALEFGIAVNVFWRHLDDQFYDPKDIYGSKDLVPATRAMQIADRALKVLEEMPEDYRDFYARRLIAKIGQRALRKATES